MGSSGLQTNTVTGEEMVIGEQATLLYSSLENV